jgi:hypothetical protein
MPKSWNEFSAADWRRLRPLTQAVKTLRYGLIDRAYCRRPAAMGDAVAVAQLIRGRRVLVTVAFGDPELVSWQTCLLRRFVPNVLHMIVDNSVADEAAREIYRVAGDAGAAYLRAPANPWSGDAASRSHGIVLNWTWRNVILAGEPEAFGFIDHDIFPTAAADPFAPLAGQDVYGIVRTVGPRWFLWAGFCTFRFAAVKDKALDFGQDWFVGLDTGGGNWRVLYKGIERSRLQEPPTHLFAFKPGIEIAQGPLQWCGTWLHEVGLMGDPHLFAEKRAAVAAMLSPHLEAAGAAAAIPASARFTARRGG